MTIAFPKIEPSALLFTPATYNVITPKFRDIIVSPRLLADKPNSPTLSLEFRCISADNILSIFTAWENSYSGYFGLSLPSEITSSIASAAFILRVTDTDSIVWRFSSEPTLSNVTAGVGDVSVQLKGDRRSTLTLLAPNLLVSYTAASLRNYSTGAGSVVIDYRGNTYQAISYAAGGTENSGVLSCVLTKRTSLGEVSWCIKFCTTVSDYGGVPQVALSPSGGEVYVLGTYYNPYYKRTYVDIYSIRSDGTMVWSKRITHTASNPASSGMDIWDTLSVNPVTGSIYVGCCTSEQSRIICLNPDGTFRYSRSLVSGVLRHGSPAIVFDGAGNVITVAQLYTSSGVYSARVAKFSDAGTFIAKTAINDIYLVSWRTVTYAAGKVVFKSYDNLCLMDPSTLNVTTVYDMSISQIGNSIERLIGEGDYIYTAGFAKPTYTNVTSPTSNNTRANNVINKINLTTGTIESMRYMQLYNTSSSASAGFIGSLAKMRGKEFYASTFQEQNYTPRVYFNTYNLGSGLYDVAYPATTATTRIESVTTSGTFSFPYTFPTTSLPTYSTGDTVNVATDITIADLYEAPADATTLMSWLTASSPTTYVP